MYEYDKNMLKLQSRHASAANQLDHISPVKGVETGIEHYRNKILLGSRDNGVKSNRQPSKAALDYMQIGTSKSDMIDKAASSPWPKQTPRDKRTILQGDLNIDMTKGMGRRAPNGDLHLPVPGAFYGSESGSQVVDRANGNMRSNGYAALMGMPLDLL